MSLGEPTSFLREESSLEKLALAYGGCLVNIHWLYLTEKEEKQPKQLGAANHIMQPRPQISARKTELSSYLY